MKNTLFTLTVLKFRRAFLLFLLLFGAGCTQSVAFKVESEIPVPLVSKIPISMGVYYDEAFRHYVYRENSNDRPNWEIESGPSQVALFDQVLPSMFNDIKHLESLADTGPGTGINAILIPVIEEMQFSLPQETRLDIYEVWIKYRIRLLESDGSLISEWPLTAYGKTETEFFKNREQGLNNAMELALRDAGAKLAIGFPEVKEVKEWLAARVD